MERGLFLKLLHLAREAWWRYSVRWLCRQQPLACVCVWTFYIELVTYSVWKNLFIGTSQWASTYLTTTKTTKKLLNLEALFTKWHAAHFDALLQTSRARMQTLITSYYSTLYGYNCLLQPDRDENDYLGWCTGFYQTAVTHTDLSGFPLTCIYNELLVSH